MIGFIVGGITLVFAAGVAYMVSILDQEVFFQQLTRMVLVGLVWVVAITLVSRYLITQLVRPLEELSEIAGRAAKGDLSKTAPFRRKDEIGKIASALDQINRNQFKLAEFSERIGDGDFNAEYTLLGENDKLGMALTGMRNKLQDVAREDQRRHWASQGLAKFGELLREDNEDMQALSDTLLYHLIKYLDANQGFIFLAADPGDDNKRTLELVSAYAWERKKYLTRKIEFGEGLTGQSAIEKNTLYLTEVPEDYIHITSGLGDASPRSLLVVPLLFNEEIYGVIELASFKPLENCEIQFVEEVAEIIASAISRFKSSQRTQQLLLESQKLTEELRTQEEEMRQSFEEMNATQEEMQVKELERASIFNAINNTLATIEFDIEGRIIDANDKFLEMMKYSFDEIENKTDRLFADQANESIEVYNDLWDKLREGHSHKDDFKRVTKDGRHIWINASYTPALDNDGVTYKIIALAQDITEKKTNELELHRQSEELKAQGEKLMSYTRELEDMKKSLSQKLEEASAGLKKKIEDIEHERSKNIAVLEGCVDGVICFDQNGIIEYFNNSAEDIWSIQRDQVIGKSIQSVMPVMIENKDKELSAYFSNNGSKQEIGVRSELSLKDAKGNELDLLITLTRAKLEKEITFTLFAQKISVDLF